MITERLGVGAVTVALVAGVLGLLVGVSGPLPVGWRTLLVWTVAGTTLLFGATAVVWTVLTYIVGAGYEAPDPVHGPEDVHVRILTIDAAEVVQGTVDSLPEDLDDVHVVAEEAIDVAGATVHVVPEDFECAAVRKGRAIEWARRTLETDRELVLYLDEDSHVSRFEGLPDADIVQLRERPRRTGSLLSYLADVYRMGVQLEQRAFARLSIPLFAWGGGIAVRPELEDAVTWDVETLVEDTAFAWRAARDHDASFALAAATCRNEAPPSLWEIAQQRRRWAAGTVRAAPLLPARYELLTRVRNLAWALSPVVTLVAVPLALLGLGLGVAQGGLVGVVALGLGLFTVLWSARGVLYYGSDEPTAFLALPFAPIVSLVHSMGTVLGIVDPPGEFRVTEKVGERSP